MSEGPQSIVVGTAGHIDHGKTTLVRALTGVNTDRLSEEQKRGITIVLGFAPLELPGGLRAGVVDVPGHERFIKNMLAGVGGVDLAMLIVAADESVMPQTREHLAILDILQIRKGIVVITKTDTVDEELVELVKAEVEDFLEGTSFQGCPMVGVSAHTGDGLDELKSVLDQVLDNTESRRDLGRPRLPVDRSFTISGFGTVVTGTLIDGALTVGQEVELANSGRHARIRGLQTHQSKVDQAQPGVRLAVNLSGLSRNEVTRGEVLTAAGGLRRTNRLDARVRMVKGAPTPFVTTRASHSIYLPARPPLASGFWTPIAWPLGKTAGSRFSSPNPCPWSRETSSFCARLKTHWAADKWWTPTHAAGIAASSLKSWTG